MSKRILVTGAGGFIGGHLAKRLLAEGNQVRCVDVKPLPEWYQKFDSAENISADCALKEVCESITKDIDIVFNLACRMGGMQFIYKNKAQCINSVLINTHLLDASVKNKVDKYLFSSSACIYPIHIQETKGVVSLKESDAYPAHPEPGYGEEKLFSERMCQIYQEDYGIKCFIPRFFNIYGPQGTWDGGKEKAPAALSRKVAKAKLSNDLRIDIGGDGEQLRNFTFIDDLIEGLLKLINSNYHDPINIGSDEVISINNLVSLIENIANVKLDRNYLLDFPRGVSSRNTNNDTVKSILNWEPQTSLRDGMTKLYTWIENEIKLGHSGV